MSEESILNPSSSQLVSPTQNDSEELSMQDDKYNVLLARIEKLYLEMNNSQQAMKSLKEELVLTKEVNQQMSTEIHRSIEVKGDLQIEEAWKNLSEKCFKEITLYSWSIFIPQHKLSMCVPIGII